MRSRAAGVGLLAAMALTSARVTADQSLPRATSSVASLVAVRGETAAFEVVLDDAEGRATLGVPTSLPFGLVGSGRHLSGDVRLARFVDVRARSRNDRSPGALGFTEAGSPSDQAMLGRTPDALLTPEQAARADAVDGHPTSARVFAYAEVFVPENTPAGRYEGALTLRVGRDRASSVRVELEVLDAELPYRAVPMHAYYERETLERYFVDPDAAELDLVRTLHAHQLDVLVQLTRPEHVERVSGALDGAWFTGDYAGPGRGIPASVVALGTYGTLGDPGPAALEEVARLASHVPASAADVFVYAIDEQCRSRRGPRWRGLLREAGLSPRVRAGHTCHEDPTGQDVDVVMMPAQSFDLESA